MFQKHKVRPAAAAAAQERIRAERTWREPWQRADETVANYADVEGLAGERGAILFRRSDDRVWLVQGVAADEEAASELLQSLPPDTATLTWLNAPDGDHFSAAISSLGGRLALRQHEMVLALSPV